MLARPILIAYDGSEDAKGAITRAGELLTPGPALVVTIWHSAERLVSARSTNWSAPTLERLLNRVPISRARWASMPAR